MIVARRLPPGALLAGYEVPGGYVDCLEAMVPRRLNLGQLITAFYNSRAFRAERWLLGSLLGMRADNADVARLAAGEVTRFSAWMVEDRTEDEVLLCDFQHRTRSWLMVQPSGQGTTVRFGTAVVPARNAFDRLVFRSLLWFHRFYARRLLSAAVKDLAG